MSTKPSSAFNSDERNNSNSTSATSFSANEVKSSSFDNLFEAVFDSMKMQELVGNAELANMLNTIAQIKNYYNR